MDDHTLAEQIARATVRVERATALLHARRQQLERLIRLATRDAPPRLVGIVFRTEGD